EGRPQHHSQPPRIAARWAPAGPGGGRRRPHSRRPRIAAGWVPAGPGVAGNDGGVLYLTERSDRTPAGVAGVPTEEALPTWVTWTARVGVRGAPGSTGPAESAPVPAAWGVPPGWARHGVCRSDLPGAAGRLPAASGRVSMLQPGDLRPGCHPGLRYWG